MNYRVNNKSILLFLSIIFSNLLLVPAFASLPLMDSQGERLPSLAPMLKHVMPAVVNIATSGTERIETNPLFNDPFFRHFFEQPSRPRQRKTN